MRINNNFVHHPQVQTSKEFLFKSYGEDGIEAAYIMQHHHDDIFGQLRFLFIMLKESKEDLESEDGKCGID